MIKIKDLFKNYGRNVVLTGLELQIGGNGIFAVLGPNGSGKTTLIKCILGMVLPQSGSISISDEPVENQWKYREMINYLPQIANFPGNLKVNELIRMIKDLRQKSGDEEELIQLFGLEPFLDKRLSTLSGGRSEEHTSELQSRGHLVCRLLLEKKNKKKAQDE